VKGGRGGGKGKAHLRPLLHLGERKKEKKEDLMKILFWTSLFLFPCSPEAGREGGEGREREEHGASSMLSEGGREKREERWRPAPASCYYLRPID